MLMKVGLTGGVCMPSDIIKATIYTKTIVIFQFIGQKNIFANDQVTVYQVTVYQVTVYD